MPRLRSPAANPQPHGKSRMLNLPLPCSPPPAKPPAASAVRRRDTSPDYRDVANAGYARPAARRRTGRPPLFESECPRPAPRRPALRGKHAAGSAPSARLRCLCKRRAQTAHTRIRRRRVMRARTPCARRIEPATSCLQAILWPISLRPSSGCHGKVATTRYFLSGASRDRTGDLLLANEAGRAFECSVIAGGFDACFTRICDWFPPVCGAIRGDLGTGSGSCGQWTLRERPRPCAWLSRTTAGTLARPSVLRAALLGEPGGRGERSCPVARGVVPGLPGGSGRALPADVVLEESAACAAAALCEGLEGATVPDVQGAAG